MYNQQKKHIYVNTMELPPVLHSKPQNHLTWVQETPVVWNVIVIAHANVFQQTQP